MKARKFAYLSFTNILMMAMMEVLCACRLLMLVAFLPSRMLMCYLTLEILSPLTISPPQAASQGTVLQQDT